MTEDGADMLVLTSEIVSAYLTNNSVRAEDIPGLIRSVRSTLTEDTTPPAPEAAPETPKATSAQVRKSITPDALVSFVDNKPYKTLKRHLARHGMTMDDYRGRYGLPKDYPSVASNYSARRSEMAKTLGLGARGRGAAAAAPQEEPPAPAPAKKTRGRKAAAE